MASQQKPQLSQGNRLYLYRLLRNAIGAGKQTFITQVEEALDAEDLPAMAIGYESTRELLEDLEEFITLTVFKGGRVYATIVSQPAWDEALEALDDSARAKSGQVGGKPWKRKKGPKGIKPVKPRIIPPADPTQHESPSGRAPEAADTETKPESDAETNSSASPESAVPTSPSAEPQRDAASQQAPAAEEPAHAPTPESAASDDTSSGSASPEDAQPGTEPLERSLPEAESPERLSSTATAPEAVHTDAPESEPAYSLTVTYDPEHEDAGVTTLESTPGEAAAQQHAVTPDASASAPADDGAVSASALVDKGVISASAPADEGAIDLHEYPRDFAEDVYCPAPLLRKLGSLLPFGADALGIAGEWFLIACARGTAEIRRNRAAFPLTYIQDGKRRTATIRLKRRPAVADRATWVVDDIEAASHDGASDAADTQLPAE